jgi:hypothetical protein
MKKAMTAEKIPTEAAALIVTLSFGLGCAPGFNWASIMFSRLLGEAHTDCAAHPAQAGAGVIFTYALLPAIRSMVPQKLVELSLFVICALQIKAANVRILFEKSDAEGFGRWGHKVCGQGLMYKN